MYIYRYTYVFSFDLFNLFCPWHRFLPTNSIIGLCSTWLPTLFPYFIIFIFSILFVLNRLKWKSSLIAFIFSRLKVLDKFFFDYSAWNSTLTIINMKYWMNIFQRKLYNKQFFGTHSSKIWKKKRKNSGINTSDNVYSIHYVYTYIRKLNYFIPKNKKNMI